MKDFTANLKNRTYYLCIEDQYASLLIREWFYAYKETPMQLRAPKKSIEGSFVVTIQDADGKHLDFIERIARITHARIEVK